MPFARDWANFCQALAIDLKGLQVSVYGSGGSPYHYLALAALWGADVKPVRAEDFSSGCLDTLDVIIFPGGGFKAMGGMLEPLGVEGARCIRHWVASGGMYIGSCAGSFLPAYVGETYWQAHEEARQLHMVKARLANSSDSIFEGLSSPGVGTLSAKITNPDHWLVKGLPESFEIVHYNGPLFAIETESNAAPFSSSEGVMQPVSATEEFTPAEAFMSLAPEELLLNRCIRQGAFNGLVSSYGEGQVVLFGSHPEFGFDVLQLGWKEPVRLIANALRFQARQRKSQKPENPSEQKTADYSLLFESAKRLERSAALFDNLAKASANPWLTGELPSFLGREASQLWQEATSRGAEVALATANLALTLSKQASAIDEFWLDDPQKSNQDVGFMGLKQLSFEIEKQLELALKQLDAKPVQLAHAYDGFGVHPYQIAVSSYLSAAGLCAAAHLLTVTIAKLSHKESLIPYEFLLA